MKTARLRFAATILSVEMVAVGSKTEIRTSLQEGSVRGGDCSNEVYARS
jgi:hypothetical protein